MYAALCRDIDDTLTLLEEGNVWKARKTLQRALNTAEELYISGEQAEDEPEKRRERKRGPERPDGR